MSIYKYNPNVKYTPKNWGGDSLNLSKNRIYVNQKQYVDLKFPDIFEDYNIVRNKDQWKLLNTEPLSYTVGALVWMNIFTFIGAS